MLLILWSINVSLMQKWYLLSHWHCVFASFYTWNDIKKDSFLHWLHLILDDTIIVSMKYEGGIKSNATNDVKRQLKVGLHLCLFQIVNIPSLNRYTHFQTFNPILEDFLIVFFVYTSKEV